MNLPAFESLQTHLRTVADWQRFAASTFAETALHYGHGTDNAWDDASALVIDSLKLPHTHFSTYQYAALTESEQHSLYDAIKQRIASRMPVPYLTHRAWFMDLPFYVDERVLIPRSPLAEIIQQQLEPWVFPEQVTNILELCTGSGCIAVALAKVFPWAQVSAVDIDADALAVAARNIHDYNLAETITLYQGDLFASLPKESRFQVIITNPPYVPAEVMLTLPEEYRHEPSLALVAGDDGLDCVRKIIETAPDYLTDDGVLIVEVGVAETQLVEAYPHLPFTWLEFERGGTGVFLLTKEQLRSQHD